MRIFVVDHNCILCFGHNSKSVRLYTDFFRSLGLETMALVPKNYTGKTAQAERVLNYPYSYLVEPDKPTFFQRRRVNRFINKLSMAVGFDAKLLKLRINWETIIKQYQIGNDDLVFFPSTDFFGAASLIQHLEKRGRKHHAPRIHCRFIGVMENESFKRPYPRLDLIRLIKSNSENLNISVSAETPTYAAYLRMLLRQDVSYFPYPLFEARPRKVSSNFLVSSPGSGRADKGFFDSLAIAQAVLNQDPDAKIRLVIQDMQPKDKLYNPNFSKTLATFPNVDLLAASLPEDDIDAMMQSSYGYFLPYSPGTYRQRGSAIFQEAISYGKSVIVKQGTGFSDLVTRYKAGHLAETPADFAKSIQKLYLGFKHGDMIDIDRGLYLDDLEQAALLAIGNLK